MVSKDTLSTYGNYIQKQTLLLSVLGHYLFNFSAVQVLGLEGQILVTLCKGQGGTPADKPQRAWHDSWQVVSMAANSGLILTDVRPFHAERYSAYSSTGFRYLFAGRNVTTLNGFLFY